MAAQAPQVDVVGLKALARDLAKMSDPRAGALIAYLQAAGREAAEPVAVTVRSTLPNDSGTLSKDVRVTASRTGAAVRMGRKKVPYAGWVEFGGRRHRPHESVRPFVSTGRYLFPAARVLATTSARIYEEAVTRGLDAFRWTNQTGNPADVHD